MDCRIDELLGWSVGVLENWSGAYKTIDLERFVFTLFHNPNTPLLHRSDIPISYPIPARVYKQKSALLLQSAFFVLEAGLEPARASHPLPPQDSVSTKFHHSSAKTIAGFDSVVDSDFDFDSGFGYSQDFGFVRWEPKARSIREARFAGLQHAAG